MIFSVVILLLLFERVSALSTTEPTDHEISRYTSLLDDGAEELTIELTDRYPSVLWTIGNEKKVFIKAEEGYKIAVIVVECSIDSSSSFVKISPDSSLDSDDSLLFIYNLKEHYSYLFNTNALSVEISVSSLQTSKFTANFTRYGEKLIPTTTSIPTTTIILPTPKHNDSSEITVFLEGKLPTEFNQQKVLNDLKKMILGMATEYCTDQIFPLAENITLYNILIRRLIQCSKTWHNSDKCIELTFAVPVELKEDSSSRWNGYQLNSDHLTIMWNKYSSKYLKGFGKFSPPDLKSSMKWEIIIAVGVIVSFALLLITLRYALVAIPAKRRQRKVSDAASIISSTSRRSELSLPPHYLQEAPPLFDTTYTMYDPVTDVTFGKPFDDFSDYHTSPLKTDHKEELQNSDVEESGA